MPLSCWQPSASATAQGTRRLQQSSRSNAFVVKPATYKVEYTLMNRNRLAGISPNGSITSPPLSIKLDNFGDVVADVSAGPLVDVRCTSRMVVAPDRGCPRVRPPPSEAAGLAAAEGYCVVFNSSERCPFAGSHLSPSPIHPLTRMPALTNHRPSTA